MKKPYRTRFLTLQFIQPPAKARTNATIETKMEEGFLPRKGDQGFKLAVSRESKYSNKIDLFFGNLILYPNQLYVGPLVLGSLCFVL